MTDMNPSNSDTLILDFYEVGGRPVAINPLSHTGWVWDDGFWTSDPTLVRSSYSHGVKLSQDDFVHRFPGAALSLLYDKEALEG